MAETYTEHKSRIDNAYPTLTPIWMVLSPGTADDDPVASFTTKFDDMNYLFHVYATSISGDLVWTISRGRNVVINSVEAITSLFLQFQQYWSAFCEKERVHLATHAFALDSLDDAGAKTIISKDSSLLAVSDPGGATLNPVFVADTLEYMLSANAGRIQLTALRNHDNQSVRWKLGNEYQTGPNSNFRIVRGDNIIMIRVTAEDTITTSTYTVTVTRTVGG